MTEQATILLVEDDVALSGLLSQALYREGYAVHAVGTAAAALDGLRNDPHLVILDLGLPDADGIEVCRQLRRDGRRMPVLILSARTERIDILVGMDAGANDYLTKPFRPSHLLARIRALVHAAR